MSKGYESEITEFLKNYKQQHPDTDQRQREGRARLWDKYIDPELQEDFKAATLPQQPYVYYGNE